MFFFVLFWRFYLFILCYFTLFFGFNSIRPICPIQCNPNPPWMFHRYRIRFSLFMPLNDDSVQFSRLQKPIHLISQSSNLAPNLVVLFSLLLLFCDRDTLILWHGMAWHGISSSSNSSKQTALFFFFLWIFLNRHHHQMFFFASVPFIIQVSSPLSIRSVFKKGQQLSLFFACWGYSRFPSFPKAQDKKH